MAFLWYWGVLSISLKSSITLKSLPQCRKGLSLRRMECFFIAFSSRSVPAPIRIGFLCCFDYLLPQQTRGGGNTSQGNTLPLQTSNKIVQDFSLVCLCVCARASLYTLFVFISSLSSLQSVLSDFLGCKTASSRVANQEPMWGRHCLLGYLTTLLFIPSVEASIWLTWCQLRAPLFFKNFDWMFKNTRDTLWLQTIFGTRQSSSSAPVSSSEHRSISAERVISAPLYLHMPSALAN